MMHTFSLYNTILDGTLNMAALIPYLAWRSIYFNRPELIGSICRTAFLESHQTKHQDSHRICRDSHEERASGQSNIMT